MYIKNLGFNSHEIHLLFTETYTVLAAKHRVLKGKIYFRRDLESLVPAGFTEVLMKQGGTEERSCLSKGGGSQ